MEVGSNDFPDCRKLGLYYEKNIYDLFLPILGLSRILF